MWRRRATEATPFPLAASGRLWMVCVLAVLVLSGCGAFGSSDLEFTPAKVPPCEKHPIVVNVRWNFKGATNQQVRIYISGPGGVPRLWTIGAPQGAMNTGPWMHDGSTIAVRSSKGKLLSARTLEAKSCKRSD